VMAFIAHLLERAANRPASRAATRLAVPAMVVGGYGLVGAWYASGALGVPRRFAVHPPDTEVYSLVASTFVVVFALGFLALLAEFASLGRDAWRRRGSPASSGAVPSIAGAAPEGDSAPEPPLTTPVQIATTVAIAVAAAFVFAGPIGEASEASTQFHHLAHAVQFLLGAALGAAIGSTPAAYRRLSPRFADAGLVAIIAAPAAMLLLMLPGIYESLEDNALLHGLYHLAIVGLGMITGIGATLLGRTAGRLGLIVSVGMALMYAAGVT
jgi:hypothetical protein